MGEIRLNKLIRTYNIGLQNLVDFLNSQGVEVEANPNAKISDEHLPAIEKQFGKDLEMKKASEKVDIKLTEILERTSRKQQEAAREEEFEEPVRETVIKSNVFTPKEIKLEPKPAPAPKPEPEPKPEPAPAPKPEPVPEPAPAPKPEPKPAPAPAPKPEPEPRPEPKPVPDPQPVPEPVKPEVAPEPEIKTTVVETPVIETKPAPTPAEKVSGEEIETKAETEENATPGFKVLGKIDMTQFEKKSGKKRERIAKGSQKVDVAKEGKQADNNSRKDKKDSKGAQDQGKGGKKRGRGSDRFKPAMTEEEQEAMQKEIQKQVKETYARMNDNKKNNFGAKYRKEKREQAAARTQEEMAQVMAEKTVLKVTEFVTVNDLATLMNNTPVIDVIKACMDLGLMVSINQRLDAEALVLVAEQFGYKVEFVTAELTEEIDGSDNVEETEEEQEAMQKEIQKQVKETYARMNEGKKNNFGAKYRKEKRESAAARAQ
ncbi:MAG: translation initiation factor IF-2 N-terminal domain-containing protein, partial [Bacteroidales bacterium]|nr:translation initiation factor IF-2 N-terminal domain-containing protein [Bacteroidales bacterium]